MTKVYKIAAAAALLASPAVSQEFYAGGSLSTGQVSYTNGTSYEGNIQGASIFVGARFPVGGASGSGLYLGGEVEATFGKGYDVPLPDETIQDAQTTLQSELHLGYQLEGFSVYGFYGVGLNPMTRDLDYGESTLVIYGVGAEVNISDRLALRAEYEMSSMSVDACNNYDPVDLSRASIGCVVKF